MNVLVTGYRDWSDYGLIHAALAAEHAEQGIDCVILPSKFHGWADELAMWAAQNLGLPVAEFTDGTAICLVVAFHPFIENADRTKRVVAWAKGHGVPVHVYDGCGVHAF